MQLLVENSPEDLVLRGFSQEFILQQTGVDVGYHGRCVREKLKGIDRFQYKVEYVRQHCTYDFLKNVLDGYANCLDKESVLNLCGIAGQNIVRLKQLFCALGLTKEFQKADSLQRKNTMKRGMVNKFGVDNPFKLDCFQEQACQTRKDKYGAEYTLMSESSLCQDARLTFSEHVKDPVFLEQMNNKRKVTVQKHYGVNHVMQTDEVKQKVKDTWLDRYGCYPMQTDECREKAKQTCRDKYGVDYYSQTDECREKVKQTCREKYGVDHYAQLDSERQRQSQYMQQHGVENEKKRKVTMQKRYGVDYTWENDDLLKKAHSTMVVRYGSEYFSKTEEFQQRQFEINEKRKKTCQEKYGVDYYLQTNEGKEKMYVSKKENGTFNTSLIEDYVLSKSNLEYQYKDDDRYPYACDFYDKNRDIFVEINAFWAHGFHWFDGENSQDRDKLEDWIDKSDKQVIYKKAVDVWSQRDVQKRERAKKNKLNYVTLWDHKGADFDLWCAMGCPVGHDYDHIYSWLPSRDIQEDVDISGMNITFSNMTAVVKDAQRSVFFERELSMWKENGFRKNKWGTVQAFLYANRHKYLGKLPFELTDRELLRAFRVSGLYRGFTSFNPALMLKVINTYSIKSVYDPCSGWGERMSTCALLGVGYEGCDINPRLTYGYSKLSDKFDGFSPVLHFNDAAKQVIETDVDAIITCPPYHNLELYTSTGAENLDRDSFVQWWQDVVAQCSMSNASVFAVQTNQRCRQLFLDGLESNGWHLVDELSFDIAQKDHFGRKSGKKEFESMLICRR